VNRTCNELHLPFEPYLPVISMLLRNLARPFFDEASLLHRLMSCDDVAEAPRYQRHTGVLQYLNRFLAVVRSCLSARSAEPAALGTFNARSSTERADRSRAYRAVGFAPLLGCVLIAWNIVEALFAQVFQQSRPVHAGKLHVHAI